MKQEVYDLVRPVCDDFERDFGVHVSDMWTNEELIAAILHSYFRVAAKSL